MLRKVLFPLVMVLLILQVYPVLAQNSDVSANPVLVADMYVTKPQPTADYVGTYVIYSDYKVFSADDDFQLDYQLKPGESLAQFNIRYNTEGLQYVAPARAIISQGGLQMNLPPDRISWTTWDGNSRFTVYVPDGNRAFHSYMFSGSLRNSVATLHLLTGEYRQLVPTNFPDWVVNGNAPIDPTTINWSNVKRASIGRVYQTVDNAYSTDRVLGGTWKVVHLVVYAVRFTTDVGNTTLQPGQFKLVSCAYPNQLVAPRQGVSVRVVNLTSKPMELCTD